MADIIQSFADSMLWWFLAFIVFAIAAIFYALNKIADRMDFNTKKDDSKPARDDDYVLRDYVLTKREASFFKTLLPITHGMKLYVLVKPRMADFINVTAKRYVKGTRYHYDLRRIAQKHVDFLLCDKAFKPVMAFEVDDSTHELPDRKARDIFVDSLYASIGFPVVHITDWSQPELVAAEIVKVLVPDGINEKAG